MGRNMLVGGEWRTDAEPQVTDDGEFDRVTTTFRDWIRDEPDAQFRPATGRYHIYVSRSCPWAHGVALVRRLAGLTDAVSMDVVDPEREGEGWEFSPGRAGCTADTASGAAYLREVYIEADPDFTGRVTVPVLWDMERRTIVNNESIEIMRMLATAFDGFREHDVDLYPDGYRETVDRVIDDLYDDLNNGVYRAGYAESQAAYDSAVTDVFDALDRWDDVLAEQRYLAGDRLTLADVRLFPTLVRFDEVYHTHFKCNGRRIEEYDHLWPYLRDLYGTPGFAETVNMSHIKHGYYAGDSVSGGSSGIIPRGPAPDFEAPHDRGRLPGGPPEALGPQAAD